MIFYKIFFLHLYSEYIICEKYIDKINIYIYIF